MSEEQKLIEIINGLIQTEINYFDKWVDWENSKYTQSNDFGLLSTLATQTGRMNEKISICKENKELIENTEAEISFEMLEARYNKAIGKINSISLEFEKSGNTHKVIVANEIKEMLKL